MQHFDLLLILAITKIHDVKHFENHRHGDITHSYFFLVSYQEVLAQIGQLNYVAFTVDCKINKYFTK